MTSERGIALVVSLLMTLVVVLLGTGLALSSRGGVNVSTSFRNQQTAFEAAVAGLEHGRESVRAYQFANEEDVFTNLLALGADGAASVTDSVDLANFGATNGFVDGSVDRPVLAVDGTPIVAGGIVPLGGAAYRVFVTNDAAVDGAPTVTDTNRSITLTAFGSDAASRGYSVVQGVFEPRAVPDVVTDPGLLMPGPTVEFHGPNSNAADFSGDGGSQCYPSIAVTTNAARDDLLDTSDGDGIPSGRLRNYVTCDPGGGSDLDGTTAPNAVENILHSVAGTRPNPYDGSEYDPYLADPCPVGSADPRCVNDPFYVTSVSYYHGIRSTYEGFADFLVGPAGGGGTGVVNLDASNLGTEGAPRITVASGSDVTVQPGDYGGVLVVTLNSSTNYVTFRGNFSFTGTIYVMGHGRVRRHGGGQGDYCGGVVIANTADAVLDAGGFWRVGEPTLDVTGGGTHFNGPASDSPNAVADCTFATTANYLRWGNPLNRISFQQLR